MKKNIFKILSIFLAFTHFFVVCFQNVSFAEDSADSSSAIAAVDFTQLGQIPDITGHGQASSSNTTSFSGTRGAMAMSSGGPTGDFFQKDTHTPADKFNSILQTVSADPFTGQAQTTIPIYLPAGKRDIAPPLNISYGSGSNNGILGVGWSLDLGSISRSIKKGVPQYDSSDSFISQGQELVNVGGNEYRDKIEASFTKYIFDGNFWQVQDKSGRKYFFGATENSRVVTSRGVYSWALNKITDVKGNCLVINYLKEENKLYPQEIFYTANEITGLSAKYKISFSYETRPDVNLSYVIGEAARLTKRLKTIEVSFEDKLIRKYVFEYSQSPSTGRTLLNKATEYGSDGATTAPSIVFSYRSNSGGWSSDQVKWHAPDGDFIKSAQDYGRRVYDLNGDGMFDFVVSCHDPSETSTRQWLRATHLNSQNGFSATSNWWPIPMGYFSYSVDGTKFWDDGRRLVDLTGDGIPEIIAASLWDPYLGSSGQYKNAYSFRYLDLANPQWQQDSSWNLPDGYFVYGNKVDGGVRFADFNGDGLNDISIARCQIQWDVGNLRIMPQTIKTYLNTGSSWQEDALWNSPDGYYIISLGKSQDGFDVPGDAGRRLADINGDGLADFLVASDGYKATYLNTGSGWVRNDIFNIPDGNFSESGRDQGRMLIDINGDGLADLVIAKAGYHVVYLNTGSGWQRDDSFNLPDGDFVDADGGDQGRYLADLDGDSVIDICIAKDGYKKAYLNLAGPPDLLINISNGLGATSAIEYAPSTKYQNYYPNQTGKLPFASQTVSKTTVSDGQGNSYSTTYFYKDGYFDPTEREFRGFGYVKTTDPEGNYSETYFKQDSIFKGRPDEQKMYDVQGNLLARTKNIWQSSQIYSGVNFAYLAQTDNFIYQGSAYKQTQVKFEYDTYGNPTKVISYGDVSLALDDKTQITEYVYNITDWLVSLPKHTYLLDSQSQKVSEKWFYYDNHSSIDDLPNEGLLTKEEVWLYNPLTLSEQRLSSQYTYDQYGNIISTTDALGHSISTSYDTKCYSFPVQVTNSLNQVVKTGYYGINESAGDGLTGSGLCGQVKYTEDANSQKTYTIYDNLGRAIKVVGPNDNENHPAAVYTYDLTVNPIKLTKSLKTNYALVPNYLTGYQFFDGLGRAIEAKSPAQNDPSSNQPRQVISGIVKFDSKGQVKEKYLPYFVNASADYVTPDYLTPHAIFTYDSLGRLIQTTNPDSTFSTISYPLWQRITIDENSHKKIEYYDASGKIKKVEEYNGTQIYTTNYEYDIQGNLTKVIDNQNNVTQIWYDSLGRKLKMNDPDMGVWTYEYDAVGNLIKQTDAKNQVLTFQYDSINRLSAKRSTLPATTLAEYQYDDNTKNYCIGRLSKIVDQSGQTEFFYDNLGREIQSIKTVAGSSYLVSREYDALDKLTKLTYPDNTAVSYSYDSNSGVLEKVSTSDEQLTTNYVSNIFYTPTGQIAKIQYGNNTETNYTYNPNTLRLNNLTTKSAQGNLQDFTYQFDNAGNITQINDYVNTATQSFSYDSLNRLIQAQGHYGALNYSYDSIGNMTNKEGVVMTYGKNGKLPHAVTHYGSTLIDYDANGNMIKKGSLELTYDYENRLIKAEDKLAAPESNRTTINLTLAPGWNFFSLPVIPSDLRIVSVLATISGKFDQVSRYNNVTKQFEHYANNPKYSQFDSFEYGKGYQIYINSSTAVNLTISGTMPLNQTISLKQGYNLIANPKTEEAQVETVLAPLRLGVNYSKVLYYDKGASGFKEYSAAKKEFTTFKPGISYFIYCLNDCGWQITNPPAPYPIINYTYDGDGGRVRKQRTDDRGQTISETTYIGSLYELTSGQGIESTTTKHIYAGSNKVCSLSVVSGQSSVVYFHSDHLGSSNIITDENGNKISLTEYSPYGSISEQTGANITNYKFTGKELDSSVGLYFYGARYYDPQLGRFISADTIVQAPYDPQSLNRYSYCRNNPLNYLDLSGHFWFIPFIIAAVKGALIGAAIGVTVAAATGQNIWQGAITGAISGAIFGGIGSFGLKGAAHTLAHTIGGAASGAANSTITGDDIGMNALIGAASAGGSEWLGTNVGFLKPVGGSGMEAYIDNMLRRTFIGSVMGGATSVAFGGNFGYGARQGALTSAISFTTNDWLHNVTKKLDFVKKGEEAAKQAFKDAKSSPLEGDSGGPQDAYRHARWNELMRKEIGPLKAFLVSMSHEIFDNQVTGEQSWNDFRMDTHNNFQGAFSGKDAMTLYGEGKLKVLETSHSKYDSGY